MIHKLSRKQFFSRPSIWWNGIRRWIFSSHFPQSFSLQSRQLIIWLLWSPQFLQLNPLMPWWYSKALKARDSTSVHKQSRSFSSDILFFFSFISGETELAMAWLASNSEAIINSSSFSRNSWMAFSFDPWSNPKKKLIDLPISILEFKIYLKSSLCFHWHMSGPFVLDPCLLDPLNNPSLHYLSHN